MPIHAEARGDGFALALMGDFGWDVTAAGVQSALKQAAGKPLTVQVNSYGGDALAGIAIHNMLARYPGPKTAVVEGVAASAASIAIMAADRIVMPDNAMMMIHEAWGGAQGDAQMLRDQADLMDRISASYLAAYVKKSGQPAETVAQMMKDETWMTAQEAVDLGFANEVAPPSEVRAMAVPAGRFERVPAALAASTPSQETVRMPDVNMPAGGQPAAEDHPQAAAPITVPEARAPQRPAGADTTAILDIAARNSLDVAWVQAQIAAGASREAALEAALDVLATRRPIAPTGPVRVTRDEGDTFRAHASAAIAAKMANRPIEHSAEGHEFRDLSMLGLARELMARAGERNVHRLTNADVAERILAQTHTTSDFPNVLVNSTNKVLTMLFAAQMNNWSSWCDEYEVDDFKTITTNNIGQFPEPLVMPESGPVTLGTVGEEAETFNVKERGRLLRLSRPALINDDLRAFSKLTQDAAMGAYTALRRTVFGVLTANANMADGNAAFSSAHSNLGTAGALTTTTYAELWALLAQMTTPTRSGLDPVAPPLPPPSSLVLIVPPAKARTALELTSSLIVPTAAGNALPTQWRGQVSVEMDGFLFTGNGPYYLARTEAGMRAMEIAYLRGRRTPTVSSAEAIDYTGVTFRVLFDFEAKLSTWRTIAANLG
jgi:ATP-dependent protease ClpP protease subunit